MAVTPPWEEISPPENDKIGRLPFVFGGLSFIPLLGVPFGLIAAIWGMVKWNKGGKLLVLIGLAGIAVTPLAYGTLSHYAFDEIGGVYDKGRSNIAKAQLTSIAQAIETYKVQNGKYPKSLEALKASLPENSFVSLYDPTLINSAEGKLYYYKLINKGSYHIRAYGRDGILNTDDDVLPNRIENIGLIADFSVK